MGGGYTLSTVDRKKYFSNKLETCELIVFYNNEPLNNEKLLYENYEDLLLDHFCFCEYYFKYDYEPDMILLSYIENNKIMFSRDVSEEIQNISYNNFNIFKPEILKYLPNNKLYGNGMSKLMHLNRKNIIKYIICDKVPDDIVHMFNIKKYDIISSKVFKLFNNGFSEEYITVIYDEELDHSIRLLYTKDQIIG